MRRVDGLVVLAEELAAFLLRKVPLTGAARSSTSFENTVIQHNSSPPLHVPRPPDRGRNRADEAHCVR
jgi:hypothetical protein